VVESAISETVVEPEHTPVVEDKAVVAEVRLPCISNITGH
jgi:hypothetical protein